MYVIKRDGRRERVHFDKITTRIIKLSYRLNDLVDPTIVTQKVIAGIHPGVTTVELDMLAAETAAAMTTKHPDYALLAGRICVSNLHKQTSKKFSEVVTALHDYVNEETQLRTPMIADYIHAIVQKHADVLDAHIVHERDYNFSYFGIKTLEKTYLLRKGGAVVERPQHLFMRTAVTIHTRKQRVDKEQQKEEEHEEYKYELDLDRCIETYNLMSEGWFTHATPTLCNAGTPRNQLSSCFLLTMKDDSIEGIYDTLKQCAMISKSAGGIGLAVSNIRASGSYIAGTNGYSNGLVPMLRVFNATARYVDQGGNKRPGAVACFVADTDVMTVNAGVKHIQDVQVGDLVVTHMNRVRPVVQVHKNPLGDRKLYKLKVEKSKEVIVTGNHKFWSSWTKKYKDTMVAEGWHSIEELKALMDNPATKRQACYIAISSGTGIPEKSTYDQLDVKEFSASILKGVDALIDVPGDKIAAVTFYKDKYGNARSNRSHEVNRFWTINEDLVNLFGMWLGDGCISKNNGHIRGIMFTVHRDNIPEIEFIKQTCQTAFGCNVSTHTSQLDDKQVTNVHVNSHIVGAVFMALFGSYFDGKHLPKMVFGWPLKLVNHLMAGLITTDGHISKRRFATLALSNFRLMTQLYHLCRNNGMDVSFVKGSRSKGMTCDPYSMSIPLNREILDNVYKLYHDDRIKACYDILAVKERNINDRFLKVLDITEVTRTDEWVYTLGVDEDHSYTVEGGLKVENCYLEPWHADVFEFLELKKNTGAEEMRARDLFFALWVPDLFMRRVEAGGKWTLMCPHECPGLQDVYGEAFDRLYESYEQQGKGRKQIDAQKLWFAILEAQTESGTPYMLYKDACNMKSNQKNLGTIKCSNLCTEIVEYTSSDETSVCNLASIALPMFVFGCEQEEQKEENDKKQKERKEPSTGRAQQRQQQQQQVPTFDFVKLHAVTKVATRNLNNLIDVNNYPLPETRRSNMRHRPIGLGVQGLADAFAKMRLPFTSTGAMRLNKQIFETIYHAALEASCELAREAGQPYDSYAGSPISQGLLQFDMWTPTTTTTTATENEDHKAAAASAASAAAAAAAAAAVELDPDLPWDWAALRLKIREHGVRNSLLVAPMPTASTAQILGNNESTEPFTSNIYTRRVLSGEFQMVNKFLLCDLMRLNLWSEEMKNKIIAAKGSVQNIREIPDEIKALYPTVWEISQKKLIDMAADRAPFIDQSQSLNIFIAEPTFAKLTSMHFYGWRKGLKTGMYYLRSRPAADAIQFTVDQAALLQAQGQSQTQMQTQQDDQEREDRRKKEASMLCSLTNREACEACSA